MPEHSITIERDQLYGQVWTEPVHKLSKRYFLSDRGLGKLCARYSIPVPPRGYWARVAHGQKPKRPPLPPLKPGQASKIHFSRREKDDAAAVEPEENLPPQIAFERQPENRIVVSQSVQARHLLIQSTRRYWEAQKRGEINYGQNTIPYLNVRVSQGSLPRALRFMQALFTAIESRGHSASATKDGKTIVTVLDQALELSLREPSKQIVHQPTAKELADMKRWSWSSAPKFDHVSTGDLVLTIENVWDVRHRWKDGKERRLEDQLNLIMEGLIRAAIKKRAWHDELERQRIAREEAVLRREEEAALQRSEDEKIQQWDEWMNNWKKAEDVRVFAAAVRAAFGPIEPGSKLEGRLLWAEGYANRIDPLRQDS